MKQSRKAPSISAIYEREHFSQFYEDEQSLLNNLRNFVGGGLRAGEACVVIATKEHREALELLLAQDVTEEAQLDRLVALDAEATLAEFMEGSLPNKAKFMTMIAGLLDAYQEDKFTVRAYGEMVALLWAEDNQAGAIMLEGFWNEAMRKYALTLFCAYPAHYFSDKGQTEALRAVQKMHTSFILPS